MSDGFEPLEMHGHGTRAGEDAVGLRISIFCSEGFDPSLEGIITSFDHETGKHGILFDSGVQLDIDISKERVMLEQPPMREIIPDDNSSDVSAPVSVRSDRKHHFPRDVYRHSLELRAEQQIMMDRNSRGGVSPSRQGSFGPYGDVGSRVRGYSNTSNPDLVRRDSNNRNMYMYQSASADSSPENYADTESNWSRSSMAERRRREEIIGLRITIFHTDEVSSIANKLEGLVMSYDDNTGCHGILFDSGVELDIDIHEERIKLSRSRSEKQMPPISQAQLPVSEIEAEKSQMIATLSSWIVGHTKDITLQAACKYAATLYHFNVPSIGKLAKKLSKDPSFLQQIGFDDDDLEEIMNALRVEYPSVPVYSPTSTTVSSATTSSHASTEALRQFAASSNGSRTTLQHLFQALHAQKLDQDQDGTKFLANAVAAVTGKDPIPDSQS